MLEAHLKYAFTMTLHFWPIFNCFTKIQDSAKIVSLDTSK